TFVKAIMGSSEVGTKVRLGDAKARFGARVKSIEDQMYKELVTRGYFDVSPETTRARYRKVSSTAFVVGFIVLALLGGRIFGISGWIILPLIALALVFGALSMLARAMPRKTYGGAETAAKWRAFKRYLTDLDQNRATEGATALFDKYLPYAVAFGIERTWVQKFAEAGAPPPEWYGGGAGWDPVGGGRTYRRRQGRGGWGGWGGWGTYTAGQDRGAGGGDFDLPGLPDIQGTSDRAGKSLGEMSGGLFELFDLAGSAFEAFGSSGSRGGGGGSRHRGFSGGGRSGGGGGGGRRGFG
ncbi:MAG: DUF2207 domain-containing protein, partial [Chloroflexota bacterium]|nr:DUF2207 domain-containing protein [Chloroflexota bacterium]